MTRTENLSHPAVELKLPLDGTRQQCVIPRNTSLFLWGTIAPGTHDRLAPAETARGQSQMRVAMDVWDQISWSLSINGEPVPLVTDTIYRNGGYHGLAWWIAHDPVDSPTAVEIRFETDGEQPTVDGGPLVFWTETGAPIPWTERIESTINLQPADQPASVFVTHREDLWNEHLVYKPIYQSR